MDKQKILSNVTTLMALAKSSDASANEVETTPASGPNGWVDEIPGNTDQAFACSSSGLWTAAPAHQHHRAPQVRPRELDIRLGAEVCRDAGGSAVAIMWLSHSELEQNQVSIKLSEKHKHVSQLTAEQTTHIKKSHQ